MLVAYFFVFCFALDEIILLSKVSSVIVEDAPIIQLLSIFMRLQVFEKIILGQALQNTDKEFIQISSLEK